MAYGVNSSLDDLPFQALGGQPAFAPGTVERFVAEPRIAVLAYNRRDGRPNQTPIWYCYAGGTFAMSTTTGSAKHRALARDPRVSLLVQDERPPYRAVVVDGAVELCSMADAASDPTAGIAVRYFGRVGAAEYEKLTAEEYDTKGLTLITLTPGAVKGFDNTKAIGRATLAFIRVRDRLPIPRRWL